MVRRRRLPVVLALLALTLGAAAVPAAARPADARAGYSQPTTRFVDSVVFDLLGRTATAADLDRWGGALDAGGSRGAFAVGVARSAESGDLTIGALYRRILLRDPSAAERAAGSARVQAGIPVARIAVELYGSDEYYDGAGRADDTYVKVVYLGVLGRPADPAGLSFWVQRLGGGANRTDVARSLFSSIESNNLRVNALYRKLLGRSAETSARAFWAKKLQSSDDLLLTAQLVSSNEYYRRAQTRVVTTPSSLTTIRPTG